MTALAAETILGVPVGLSRDDSHNYYWRASAQSPVQGPIPSVTGITGMVNKSGPLVGWAKREVASSAIRNLDMLVRMKSTGGDQAAIDWLKKIPDYQRDTAADIGQRIHAISESLSRGLDVQVTEEEAPFIASYQRFLAEKRPRFVNAEAMVASLKHEYAGTLDAIAEIDGELTLIDYKTGRTVANGSEIYPTIRMQIAGYRYAEFAGRSLDPKRYRVRPVTRCAVLHIRPEGYELIPVEITLETYAAFLAARRLYRFVKGN